MGGNSVSSWRTRTGVRFAFLLGALWVSAALPAASPPEWILPALSADLAGWKNNDSTVQLLEFQRTEYTGRDRIRELSRGAIKLTAEAGRSSAIAMVRYNSDTTKVRAARAWVISADGRKTRSFSRSDFTDQLAQVSRHFWNAQRVLYYHAGGDIEVGGVVAWEFECDQETGIFDTSWQFLADRPTWKSALEVVPLSGHQLVWHGSSSAIPAPVPGSRPGSLRWEMNRLEPVPADRPTDFLPDPLRLSVRCAPVGARPEHIASWTEFSRLAAEIIEPRIERTATVAAKAAELVAGHETRWARVRALCDFVQRDISYLSMTLERDSLAGYRPRPADECLGNRFGDCKDKAALLCALLRAVGDRGYATLVYSGNPTAVPVDWPSACFNHAIAAIPADADTPPHWPIVESPTLGRLVFFDPTDPVTPLGVLSDGDEGGHALVVASDGAELLRLPGETDPRSGIQREIDARLLADGVLQVKATERRVGAIGAASQRRRFVDREEQFGRTVQQQIRESLPLARNIRFVETWDAPTSTHSLVFEFSADRYARALGKERVMFNPLILAASNPLAVWKVSHEGTTWFAAQRLKETIHVELPDGFVIEELPQPAALEQAGATCRVNFRIDGRKLVAEREFARPSGFYGRVQYDALRELMQKVKETERRPAILRRAALTATAATPTVP